MARSHLTFGRPSPARTVAAAAALTATALASCIAVAASSPNASAERSITGITLESESPGTDAVASGWLPSLSGDGRLVAFVGYPSVDDGRTSTVFLRDRSDGSFTEMTIPDEGMKPGNSTRPVLTSDGCSLFVVTQIAFDVFRDDDAGDRWDVYRATTPQCDGVPGYWELVSTNEQDAALDDVDPAQPVSTSSTGSVAAYVAPVTPDAEWPKAVTIVDLTHPAGTPGRVTRAPGLPEAAPPSGPTATPTYAGQVEPALSADGRFLAYTSDALATDTAPAWQPVVAPETSPRTQVFLWDRVAATSTAGGGGGGAELQMVSALAGSQPSGIANAPTVSGDGRIVAFATTSHELAAANYGACGEGCDITQIVTLDRDADHNGILDEPSGTSFTLASRTPGTAPDAPLEAGDRSSSQPRLSADGGAVVFVSRSSNLLPAPAGPSTDPADGDIVLAGLADGSLRRISVQPDGTTPAAPGNAHPVLSATARMITWDSGVGQQMVPGSPSGSRQVVTATSSVDLSIAALDVGTVSLMYSSPEWRITLFNTGTSSFVPARIEVSDASFAITGGSCQPTVALPAGGSCQVSLVFAPLVAGPVAATLTFAEDGFGAVAITTQLTGAGGDAFLSASPSASDFDRVDVGSSSNPTVFSVSNIGFADATISQVILGGDAPQDFGVVLDGCTAMLLTYGQVCNAAVSFKPTAEGLRSALVTFVADNGARTSVVVGGRGVLRPAITTDAGVRSGRSFAVHGTGFQPSTIVALSWLDGHGRTLTVLASGYGTFDLRFPVSANEPSGARQLVATIASGDSPPATSAVTVTPAAQRRGPGTPTWPGVTP